MQIQTRGRRRYLDPSCRRARK